MTTQHAHPTEQASTSHVSEAASHGEFRRLLVAVDGRRGSSLTPVDVAAAIAREHDARPHALSVVDPFVSGSIVAGLEGAVSQAPALRADQWRRQADLRKQVAERTGFYGGWSFDVPLGSPADAIVSEARKIGADLIVMGLRRRGALDRIVHDETTLRVIRHAPAPVLAVTDRLRSMPRTVIVALDFTAASSEAAKTACDLFRGCAKIVLVYVESDFDATIAEHDEGTRVIRREGIAGAFRRLRDELGVLPGTVVETAVLRGAIVSQLTSFVERTEADVLAVARQEHGLAERVMIGSVTTALVRYAPCSMLVTPAGWRAAH